MVEDLDYDMGEHEVRLMVQDPKALAYEWIKAYVDNLNDRIDIDNDGHDDDWGPAEPITIQEVIQVASSHLEDGWGDYINRGGTFEGFYTEDTFWDKLAILKGIEIPTEKRNNFFSCSC